MAENASPVSAEIVRRRLSIVWSLRPEEWGERVGSWRGTTKSPSEISRGIYITSPTSHISSYVSGNDIARKRERQWVRFIATRRRLRGGPFGTWSDGIAGSKYKSPGARVGVSVPAEPVHSDVMIEMGIVCEKDGTSGKARVPTR